jgi:MFS family permease
MNRPRTMAAIVGIWAPLLVTAVTGAMWSDRLPARMATHWSGTGPADGYSSARVFWGAMLALGIVAGLAAIGSALRRGGAVGLRYLLGVTGALAGGVAGIWVATATATLADPADARLGWRLLWFVAGVAWGAVVVLVAGPAPATPPPPVPAVTPLDLGPTERAAYSTTLRAPLIIAVTFVAAVAIAVVAASGPSGLWPVVAVPVVALLLFGQVRVTADRRGLRLVAGLLGIPFKTIPLHHIAAVEVAEIDPLEWGGWGYRVTPGRSALVLRRGPGLVLHQTDGRRFAVTLDDPQTPAGLLTALLSRAG